MGNLTLHQFFQLAKSISQVYCQSKTIFHREMKMFSFFFLKKKQYINYSPNFILCLHLVIVNSYEQILLEYKNVRKITNLSF